MNDYKDFRVTYVQKVGTSKTGTEFMNLRVIEQSGEFEINDRRPLSYPLFADLDPESFANIKALIDVDKLKSAKTTSDYYEAIKDMDTLKKYKITGKRMSFKIPPTYVIDSNGNNRQYPEGHPDAGKAVVSDRVEVFVRPGEEDVVRQRMLDLTADRRVDTRTTTPENYNGRARRILKEYVEENNKDEDNPDEATVDV